MTLIYIKRREPNKFDKYLGKGKQDKKVTKI